MTLKEQIKYAESRIGTRGFYVEAPAPITSYKIVENESECVSVVNHAYANTNGYPFVSLVSGETGGYHFPVWYEIKAEDRANQKDYTIIWVESWMSGSHHHSLTKKKFVRAYSPEKIMNSQYGDGVIYLFEGHIPTLGEEIREEDVEILE